MDVVQRRSIEIEINDVRRIQRDDAQRSRLYAGVALHFGDRHAIGDMKLSAAESALLRVGAGDEMKVDFVQPDSRGIPIIRIRPRDGALTRPPGDEREWP